MLNNHFVVRQSEHLAARAASAGDDPAARVDALFRLALGRHATPDEVRGVGGYASRHGLANACRMILNSNEFLFVN